MRSGSDGRRGRRGRSLLTVRRCQRQSGFAQTRHLTAEIGVRPASRSAPAPQRSPRSRFIKNTSVTAGKQMADLSYSVPAVIHHSPPSKCARGSLFFAQLLTSSLREGKHQGYSMAEKKKPRRNL